MNITSSPIERASNFGLEMPFFEPRLIFLLQLKEVLNGNMKFHNHKLNIL
jgi:hypothetical protein